MSYRSIVVLLAAGSMAACSSPNASDPGVCTPMIVPAVLLSLRDARTQAPIAANAVVSAQISTSHGSFSETHVGSDALLIPVGAMPGTYDLLLKKSGYVDVTKNGIVVPSADAQGCQPKTVSLEVLLQPNS